LVNVSAISATLTLSTEQMQQKFMILDVGQKPPSIKSKPLIRLSLEFLNFHVQFSLETKEGFVKKVGHF